MANKLKKTLTPEQYEALSGDDQDFYNPEYAKYKIKKTRSYNYCESCDHKCFSHWHEYKAPIGKPIKYNKLTGIAGDIHVYHRRRMREYARNVIAIPGKTINFTRYSPLDKEQ